ncbi:autotransporter domain-containing protein [Synechococcus sp. MIT S9503]|uniref:autotransporter domain-containing protein n=1 Tax=Synechococcus sp. MIT S9503 TaxID=3082547 RepID=UPI0039A466E5
MDYRTLRQLSKLSITETRICPDTTFIPRLSLGYAWDLGETDRSLTARLNSAPKGSFYVDSTPAPSSWFNFELGLDVAINDRFSVYLNGREQLSPSSSQSINYGGGFRWYL